MSALLSKWRPPDCRGQRLRRSLCTPRAAAKWLKTAMAGEEFFGYLRILRKVAKRTSENRTEHTASRRETNHFSGWHAACIGTSALPTNQTWLSGESIKQISHAANC